MADGSRQSVAVLPAAGRSSLHEPAVSAANETDPQLASQLARFSRGGAAFAAAIGLLVLVGWALDIAVLKSVAPAWVTMKPNTALGFVLTGAAVWILHEAARRPGARLLAGVIAGFVAVLGLATLSQDLAGWNLGIDQLMFRESAPALETASPGRMAPATALNFVLLGGALLLLACREHRWQRTGVSLAFAVLSVSALAAMGYVYGVPTLYRVAASTSMALHTAVTFIALSLAALFACGGNSWATLIVSRGAGGHMLRRAWLPTILFLVLLGALRVRDDGLGLRDTEFGLALMIVSVFAVLTALLWRGAAVLDRSEADRQRETEAFANVAAIVESSGDAIVSCAPDGTVLSWNAGAEQLLGYTAAEVVGRNIALISPPDRHHELVHHVWLLDYGKSMPPFETIRLTKDGREIRVQMGVSAIRNEDGKMVRYAAILREPTERELAQEAVKESQRRLAMLMDNLPGVAYRLRHDAHRTVEFLSRGCFPLTGRPPEDFVQNKKIAYAEIMAPEDRQPVWDAVQRAVETRQHYLLEYRISTASGTTKWVWEQGCGVYAIEGELVALEGLILDVTDRRQARAELERNAQLARLMESLARAANEAGAPDAALQACLEQICSYGNWSLGHVALYAPGHSSGVPQTSLWHTAEPERFGKIMRQSDEYRFNMRRGGFVGEALHDRKPVWVEDLSAIPRFGRLEALNASGLRAGFVFPVVVGEDIGAFLEFFSEEPRAPDLLIMEAIGRLASQLARVIERSRAEALRVRLAAIVDASEDAIFSIDRNFVIQTWNPGAERMLGYSAGEAVGRHADFLVPEDRLDELLYRRATWLSGREMGQYESVRLSKDGHRVAVSVSASPLRNAAGEITGAALIYRDITGRKRAEAERMRLSAIVESSEDAIFSRALDGTVLSWNRGAERMFGYAAHEMIGRNISIISPADSAQRSQENTAALLRGESVPVFETVRLANGGREVDVQISVSALYDDDGKVAGVAGIMRDISDRKRAEEKRVQLAEIVESSHDAIVRTSADGTILTWNAGAERLFGYTAAEAVGRDVVMIIPQDRLGELAEKRKAVLAGRGALSDESERLAKDGRRIPVSISAFATRDSAGNATGVAIIFRDLTERKRAQREAERKAHLTALLEALARNANEAFDAAEGMRASLKLIHDHGAWCIARLALLAPETSETRIAESLWHGPETPRYGEFRRVSDEYDYNDRSGKLISIVVREQLPIWLEDIPQAFPKGRLVSAVAAGLRSAFAFPVVVTGKVVAFLEFFAEEAREPDDLLMQAAPGIGSQLARLIERQRALEAALESARQMKLVTENMPAMLAYFDSELRCHYANQAYCEFQGVDGRKIKGMTLRELVATDVYEKALANPIPEVMSGRPVTVRRDHRMASGELRHIEIRRVPDLDAAGRVCGYYAMLLDVTDEVRRGRELARKAALSELMELLARTVDEAPSPEAAMRACLEKICEHGAWSLGRLGIYGLGEGERFPENSLWHSTDTTRHESFMRASLDPQYFAPGGRFITVVLKERKAVWLADISSTAGFGRMEVALACGLRSAFAFPVIVGNAVAAFLEFFADEPREADGLFLEAIGTIGSQLARAIERQRALDELRAREKKLADILDGLHEVVWSMDVSSGRILYVNPAVKKLARRPVTDFLADRKLWRKMVHPDDRRRVRESIRTLLREGELTQEFRIVLADGEVRSVEDRARVAYDAQGTPQRIDGTIIDVTERRRAEAERAQLAAIVENSDDAIIGRHLDGTIISWNAAAERLYGYSASEVLGKRMRHLLTPPELRKELARGQELVRRGVPVPPFETVRMSKDGRRIHVQMSISPIRGASGAVIGRSTIARDITERKRAEAERAQLAAIVESSNDAIIGRTLDGIITSWNAGAERLLGWTAQEAIGRPAAFVMPEGVQARIATNNGKIRSGEIVMPHETRRITKAGTVIDVMSSVSPIRAESGEIVGASNVLQDISVLKAAQTAAQESDARLRATFEQASVGMVLRSIDPTNPCFIQVNEKLCDMLGYTREEMLQLTPLDITPPEDRPTASSYANRLVTGEVTSYSREKRYVHKDGSIVWGNVSVAVVRGPNEQPSHVISMIQDITEHKEAERRADFLAHYDVLTGLPNRQLFTNRLKQALARDRRLGKLTALLFVDLDRFKQINETLGHSAGDDVLQQVTARLRERLRQPDTMSRLGSDEFAILVESVTESAQPLRVAQKIMEALAEPFTIADEEVFVNASIGVAVSVAGSDGETEENLIENAELAMYRAKQEGRNNVQLFVPDSATRRSPSLNVESRLRRALERDELLLNFQPKVNVRTGAITAAEALIRWHNPDLGMVSPADFIPIAEETGLIVPIGEWVLHTACAQASAWRSLGHPIAISVNLSARQFTQRNLVSMVERTLADTALPADWLELEITESMIMRRPDEAIATLKRLNGIGLALSVDDFGTGYSSLSYLKRFPVHKLKIDKSFVSEIHQNADDAAIVRAVIALAKNLNLKTIAEGVETEQQLIFLAGLQCDEYQGYYFSKPLPVSEFVQLLTSRETSVQPPAGAAAPSRTTARHR